MGFLDIVKQYAAGTTPSGDVYGHFDSVAQQVPPHQLGGGIAAALRSDATPPFGQALQNLFGQSSPEQKAGLLNEIMQSVGPAAAASLGGGLLGRILGNSAATSNIPVSSAQAAQVSPSDLNVLATDAHNLDPSLVDRVGAFYAQHPTLVKTLGVAALGAVMSHMNQHA